MFLKRTIRRNGTESKSWYIGQCKKTIKEMLAELGINDVVEVERGSSVRLESSYIEGFPNSCGKVSQYRYSSMTSDTSGFTAQHFLKFTFNGVNIVIGLYWSDSSDMGYFNLLAEFTEMGRQDYYNSKEGTNSNFLGCKSLCGYSRLFGHDTSMSFTIAKNDTDKTLYIGFCSDSPLASGAAVKGAHICVSSLTNYGPVSNDNAMCLPFSYGTPSSRKDYGVTEEVFRVINPISFYGGEAFDYVDNIDKIHNKAYIQKPLVAMYKRGIIGEMQGIYFATIKAPNPGDLVSMGGITYIYMGNGMYFKNEV